MSKNVTNLSGTNNKFTWNHLQLSEIIINNNNNNNNNKYDACSVAANCLGSNRTSKREADLKLRARLSLNHTKSNYPLIVSITKCKNLSLGIFINVNKSYWTVSFIHFSFSSWIWTAYLVTIFSLILIGYQVLCSEISSWMISLANGICYFYWLSLVL